MLFPNINDVSDILTISLWCQRTPKVHCPCIQPTVVCVMAQSPESLETLHLCAEPGVALSRLVWLHRRLARTHVGSEPVLRHRWSSFCSMHDIPELVMCKNSSGVKSPVLAGYWGLPPDFSGCQNPEAADTRLGSTASKTSVNIRGHDSPYISDSAV